MVRKKNYKDHKCTICDREFKSVRSYCQYCSGICRRYAISKKYWQDIDLGLKIDPHNKSYKTIYRRIMIKD